MRRPSALFCSPWRRFTAMFGAGLLFAGLLASLGVQPAQAYQLLDCKTADHAVSYQMSNSELAGRDYLALADLAVGDWTATSTPVYFYESGSPRDVLIGGLYYGNTDFNAIARPYPECRTTYGGVFPVTYTYARLNKTYTDAWPSSRVRYTFEHELGHILGLAHPAENSSYCPLSHRP